MFNQCSDECDYQESLWNWTVFDIRNVSLPLHYSYDQSDEGEEGSGMSDGGSSGNMVMARWSKVEDSRLKTFVEQHGEEWDVIAACMKNRTDQQCQHRWNKVVNPNLIKGPWTKEVRGYLLIKF